jgi:hypothetical protein
MLSIAYLYKYLIIEYNLLTSLNSARCRHEIILLFSEICNHAPSDFSLAPTKSILRGFISLVVPFSPKTNSKSLFRKIDFGGKNY